MATIHDIEIDDFLASCVRITPEAIEEEYVRLPADLAYWNQKHADAVRCFLFAKIDTERLYAQLLIEHREKLADKNAKVTEAMVNSAVETDPLYSDARIKLVEAEVEKARLAGVLDAIRTKRDMLISVGAHIRVEMSGDPQLKDEARGRRMMRGG